VAECVFLENCVYTKKTHRRETHQFHVTLLIRNRELAKQVDVNVEG